MFPDLTHGTGSTASQVDGASKIRNTMIEVSGIARANGSLLLSEVGSIEVEPVTVTVIIERNSGSVIFALSWVIPIGSPNVPKLSMDLDAHKVSNSGNVRLIQYRDRPYIGFQVDEPAPGDWEVKIKSDDNQRTGVNFRLFVFNQNPHITGGIILRRQAYNPGETVPLQFQCSFDRPLTNLEVLGTVTLPSGENISIEFTDQNDRPPGNGRPGDGLYSGSLQDTSVPGNYIIKLLVVSDGTNVNYADVDGPPGGGKYDYDPIPAFRREYTTTLVIGEPVVKRIVVEPNGGYPGQKLQVKLIGDLTNFTPADTTFDFGEGISVGDINVDNFLTASATIIIDRTATFGTRSITAITGSETVKTEEGFQVISRQWVWSDKLIINLLILIIILLLILLLIMAFLLLRGP